MRKIKLTLAGISSSFVLTALLMCFSTSAFASGPTITANVQAGTTVTATASDANISDFTLDGHTSSATYDLPITVVDSRGDASGWSLTMTSTTFATSDDSHELATDASTVNSIALAAPDGTLPVASGSGHGVVSVIPAASAAPDAVKIFSAASGSGMGTTTVTPTVHIAIPGAAYAGNYYSTITIGTNLVP